MKERFTQVLKRDIHLFGEAAMVAKFFIPNVVSKDQKEHRQRMAKIRRDRGSRVEAVARLAKERKVRPSTQN